MTQSERLAGLNANLCRMKLSIGRDRARATNEAKRSLRREITRLVQYEIETERFFGSCILPVSYYRARSIREQLVNALLEVN